MLGTLVVGAAQILCVARRTYPRDVATAMACEAFAAPVQELQTSGSEATR